MNTSLVETPLDIIVAEDEAITRQRLVTSLEAMGHTVRAFCDGVAAWQAYDQKPSKVIISDWQCRDWMDRTFVKGSGRKKEPSIPTSSS